MTYGTGREEVTGLGNSRPSCNSCANLVRSAAPYEIGSGNHPDPDEKIVYCRRGILPLAPSEELVGSFFCAYHSKLAEG